MATRRETDASSRMHSPFHIAAISVSGTRTLPIFLLSASTHTGCAASNLRSSAHTRLSNIFCEGCGAPGRRAQQAALAGTREPADHAPFEMRRTLVQSGDHGAPVGFVTAVEPPS